MNPWLLFILPLASAAIIQLGLKRHAFFSSILSTASVVATFVVTLMLFNYKAPEGVLPYDWITVGDFKLQIGIQLDQLSKGMMVVVTGIGMLVHIFSLGYMKDDAAKARFFGNLSMFMFSMTGIVLATNFIMMFVFWELVGLSSYLLIGHWYQKDSAADAAKKAFITNRIGDFLFMAGILLFWGISGTFVFSEMAIPGAVSSCLLGVSILCIFGGAMGKSAQFPLHVWLPDAMEGPTPVSALIHAATMVAAGVYMLVRFQLSLGADLSANFAWEVISWIGGITALLAALMATQQDDIKKVLAYSTLSQLGYMVMAVGLLAGEAAMFHLYTHAWFKGLLFLGSGAIIYACHHEQDAWKMGGLFKKMPITSTTFIIGTLALIAFPLTSGFYSKEMILEAALHHSHPTFFWIAAGVAALTTFYMLRLVFIVFFGKARAHGAEEAKEVGPIMWVPLALLAIPALVAGSLGAKQLVPHPGFAEVAPHIAPHAGLALYASIGSLIIGSVLAYVFYWGKDSETINNPLFKVFRNKFYIDEIYASIVKWTQDLLAAIAQFVDEFVIGSLCVGGLARSATGLGNIFRKKFQSGDLQRYAFLMGIGSALVIYFTVFF
ncbi:NADH-quinone oxidoreductase subunit L [Persicirhabdus sediminis]|uniref:NADH-quinone oxidoreductase subunit L n=1 Tax=Persicirhabdus sediminis TaxID=454144 RepID=A0A8J7MAQ4_9BACT|nr:NADH-quinone oxidoreductase subunit L [Persicirhabdus sediminis]MBK1789992.1 NADH-quinone oxidoreductase subunit L [Persicirhabdus sediminis]